MCALFLLSFVGHGAKFMDRFLLKFYECMYTCADITTASQARGAAVNKCLVTLVSEIRLAVFFLLFFDKT